MQEHPDEFCDVFPLNSPQAPHGRPDEWHDWLAMALHDLSGAMSVVHGTVQLWRQGARGSTPRRPRTGRLSTTPAAAPSGCPGSYWTSAAPGTLLFGWIAGRWSSSVWPRAWWTDVGPCSRPRASGSGPRCPTRRSGCRPTATSWAVLDNLLDNATKYTGVGGHVTVSVNQQGCEAVLRVQDTGVGMPPEFVPREFEPFAREDRAAVRCRPGSGVGLLAVRRIIELHGGRTEAASRGRGLGSVFTVRLPMAAEPALAAAGHAPAKR